MSKTMIEIEGLTETCKELGESDLSAMKMVLISIKRIEGHKTFELWVWLDEGSEINSSPASEWNEDEWKKWIFSGVESEDRKCRGRFKGISSYTITNVAIVK